MKTALYVIGAVLLTVLLPPIGILALIIGLVIVVAKNQK